MDSGDDGVSSTNSADDGDPTLLRQRWKLLTDKPSRRQYSLYSTRLPCVAANRGRLR
jgi:hypothetical protein